MNRIPMLKVLLGPDVGDATSWPLWRASHRALLHGLGGLSAPVAIAAFCVVYFVAEFLR